MRSVFVPLLSVALSFDLVASRAIPGSHVLHEKRDVVSSKWARHARVEPQVKLPVRIGLKQNPEAMAKAPEWLMEVSHPESEKYGKHWTQEQIAEAFRPTDEAVQKVKAWLTTVIDEHRITHTDNQLWFAFDATTAELERLVHAEYYEHRDANGKSMLSTDEYFVPSELRSHIDYIYPGVHGVQVASQEVDKRRNIHSRPPKYTKKAKPTTQAGQDNTDNCDTQISPACIRALYNFDAPDPNAQVSSSNSMGIFEEGDKYAQEDLDQFYAQYTTYISAGFGPTVDLIDGATAPTSQDNAGTESDLDFDLAIPIIYPQTTTLFQTDSDAAINADYAGFLNTFLDALDGSYCTYSAYGEKGNDPKLDPKYPDSDYKGKLMCGTFQPTNVISISYGAQENQFPQAYQQRQCNEFLKLGMQGVSVFVASGDDGVQGPNDACLGKNNKVFSPAFPNSCPWLTNVGATMLSSGQTVNDPETAAMDDQTGFYSNPPSAGGGFSNIYSIPDYQSSAVQSYFSNNDPGYKSYSGQSYGNGIYNRTGRGYPDVSANGLNSAEYNKGQFILEGGTSASTPIFAALINRINEDRIAAGKSPVGFVNPTLYANPDVFNDITGGNNPGCGTDGFYAVSGWDPVTGLGTPNYPKLSQLFNGLQ